jgi:hypothetical protein
MSLASKNLLALASHRDGGLFKNEEFAFTSALALGAAYYHGADIGESLATASRIADGDFEAWYSEWSRTAESAHCTAELSQQRGHTVSAREAYLRAATYYFLALFFLDGTDMPERLVPTWELHRGCFERAAPLFDPPLEPVAIVYEQTTLPGYFVSPDTSRRPRPLLILNNGSEGPISDMYFTGSGALERGYNLLIFDGPGQGAALFRQGLYFRFDWEKVVTPVVDYALSRPDVDGDHIAIYGASQGGYWVPRAVCFEHRIAAAIADPGVWDVSTTWQDHMPKPLLRMARQGMRRPLDALADIGKKRSSELRQTLAFRMRPFGTDSLFEVLERLGDYNLAGIAEQIRCPMLITDPDGEQFWPGQSRRLYDAIQSPKTLVRFTSQEGASLHMSPLAPGLRQQRLFDWLDETFAVDK